MNLMIIKIHVDGMIDWMDATAGKSSYDSMNDWIIIISLLIRSFLLTDGRKETVMFDKITSRISKLCYGLNPDFVDPVSVNII